MSNAAPKISIINEIESALRGGPAENRIKVLMSVTDLFAGRATKYSEQQTKLFDDVLVHLIETVESSALVEIATRLAPIPNAPLDTIKRLAQNDAIAISGPVLTNSMRLSDDDLIKIAKTKSQAHLAKIAGRTQLNEVVTDVLVDHGDADVANEVAINSGAKCSKLTIAKLVIRADGDDRLTESISRRADISPPLFRQLITQATNAVRAKLLASAKPEQKGTIEQVMNEISAQVGKGLLVSPNYAEAERIVARIRQDTTQTRIKILEFADTKHIAELIVGLSALSGVSVDQVDGIFYAPTCFGLMILCKAITLAWKTTYAVINARPAGLNSQVSLHGELCEQFNELSTDSAQKIIRFWQGRQKIRQNF